MFWCLYVAALISRKRFNLSCDCSCQLFMGTLFLLWKLILDNYHPLLSFFQLPLTPPQPADTDRSAILLFSEAAPAFGFQVNFSPPNVVAEEPCGQNPITLPRLWPSVITLYCWYLLRSSYYCMCQNLSFPSIFTIHSPVLSVVCLIWKLGQASSSVKHHLWLCVPDISRNNWVYFNLAITFLTATESLE